MVRIAKSAAGTLTRVTTSSTASSSGSSSSITASTAVPPTIAPLTFEEKQRLCEQLSSLPRDQTVDVYRLLVARSKDLAIKMPRRLGTTEPGPFGSQRIGDDYRFQIDLIPPEVLYEVQRLLELK